MGEVWCSSFGSMNVGLIVLPEKAGFQRLLHVLALGLNSFSTLHHLPVPGTWKD